MLHVGIIGYGAVARDHAVAIQTSPHARLIAVIDPRFRDAGCPGVEARGAAIFESLEAASSAERLDVAIIASPTARHADHARAAIDAGLHTLVEFPFDAPAEELDALAGAARRRGCLLSVAHTCRFVWSFARTKQLIDSGSLGSCKSIFYFRLMNRPAGIGPNAARRGWNDDALRTTPATCSIWRVIGWEIATPEQWHALATVWACQAGKDVYVEKCISRTVEEGRKMVQAARKHQRIVQAGTQHRSGPYMAAASQYIREGKLGDVFYVKVCNMLPEVYGGYPQPKVPNGDPPKGLDWDQWLGPAPERPYNAQVHRNWHGWWDFSGGNSSDGIHQLDLARMLLQEPSHPKSVQCVGGR